MTIYFKENKILFDTGSVAMSADCCCDCDATTCDSSVGGSKVITQVVFSITVPDTVVVTANAIDPGTGEPTAPYRRTTWTGLSVFTGTYTVNRAAYPDCTWSYPTKQETINWAHVDNGSVDCPSSGTTSSGTELFEIRFPSVSFDGYSKPLNHTISVTQIRTDIDPGGPLTGATITYRPVSADTHFPCGVTDIEDDYKTLDTYDACITETASGTATSNE